jgi:uncharacterized membrane protein YcaP (DUF421 family)
MAPRYRIAISGKPAISTMAIMDWCMAFTIGNWAMREVLFMFSP